MRIRKRYLITVWIVGILLFSSSLFAQNVKISKVIQWVEGEEKVHIQGRDQVTNETLSFHKAIYRYPDSTLPYYHDIVRDPQISAFSKITIGDFIFKPLSTDLVLSHEILSSISGSIKVESHIAWDRKKPVLCYTFLPLRRNPESGRLEKLVYFTYQITDARPPSVKEPKKTKSLPQSSVLKTGKWIKLKIREDGIYKISYSDLVSMGLSDPSTPRIFGNGGRMLPMNSDEPRPADLVENAILIEKGSDDVFNEGDYLLFYGKGPGMWHYESGEDMFLFTRHLYSDASYYFITSDAGSGKTIEQFSQLTSNETDTIVSFQDYSIHEEETTNLIKSGREWFEPVLSYGVNNFNFYFSNLIATNPVNIKSRLLARSDLNSSFTMNVNGGFVGSINLSRVNLGSSTSDYASSNTSVFSFLPDNDAFTISLEYNDNGYSSAECWLDYLILNAERELYMTGSQMHFRNRASVGEDKITLFQIQDAPSTLRVWEITDLYNIKEMGSTNVSGTLSFKIETDTLRQFIAFDGGSFLTPEVVQNPVPNQDLHGYSGIDMIIITHPDFLDQANQLANLHTTQDGLQTLVVTQEQIFNEFSSGAPDVSAIRDFVKYHYDHAASPGEMPKYLLLFGDGSFDNNSDHKNNTNFILTYQSLNSLGPTRSYVTDDFFGILDDGEDVITGLLDIGIGRLPVSTVAEAQSVVDKIIHYTDTTTRGEWRNMICFIGDDEDNNIHMRDANSLATQVNGSNPAYITQKIFLDAYPQISTPGGETYPEVNAAITNRVNSGALIINYVGHGNERGLAHEGILGVSDILSWNNFDQLPLFITATCEFSRFDDIERTGTGEINKKTSAGEQVLLNPDGGGIGLLTTTRLVYSNPNFVLNQNFYDYAFEKDSLHEAYRLGDILRLTKNESGSSENKRNFTLLGDPAIKLAYPKFTIVTDSLNGQAITIAGDTLKALSKVTLSGHIEDYSGSVLNHFSGIIYPVIYDKPTSVTTLGNDNDPPMVFSTQNSILYKGQASIENGRFSFSFVVPKDISYQIDFGKINYYGKGPDGDANGYYDEVLIGGFAEEPLNDNQGPDIQLYMNNEYFASGGITDENPTILAVLSDENGINTVGNGIGHDITAILDDDDQNLFVLNDFYEADLNSYQSGKVKYQLTNLTEGEHTISLKVWDVLNNSSTASIDFIVAEAADFVLKNLINYPNPFIYKTSFVFEHNQTDGDLHVIIRIFDLSGQLVKTIQSEFFADGYKIGPIEWDGRDNNGNKLGSGIYVYRVNVRSSLGETKEAFQKLVILK